MSKVTFQDVEYDSRHGGPFDRGSADSYYSRYAEPHYYVGPTGLSLRVEMEKMTKEEIDAYNAGFLWNEEFGSKKDYL
jgi:hypothetical protein